MAVRLFGLAGVPDDEADEVRSLLTSQGIDYYETEAGNWGISPPAIWLRDESQCETARHLLANYEVERGTRMRDEYARQLSNGTNRTLRDVIRENPVRFLVYLVVILAVAYFSTVPFFDIGK